MNLQRRHYVGHTEDCSDLQIFSPSQQFSMLPQPSQRYGITIPILVSEEDKLIKWLPGSFLLGPGPFIAEHVEI